MSGTDERDKLRQEWENPTDAQLITRLKAENAELRQRAEKAEAECAQLMEVVAAAEEYVDSEKAPFCPQHKGGNLLCDDCRPVFQAYRLARKNFLDAVDAYRSQREGGAG